MQQEKHGGKASKNGPNGGVVRHLVRVRRLDMGLGAAGLELVRGLVITGAAGAGAVEGEGGGRVSRGGAMR
jgi:hypothetical protein